MAAETVVVDTSALLKNSELFSYLRKKYKRIVVPLAVVNELDSIKNRRTDKLSKKAWELLSFIGKNTDIIVLSAQREAGRREYGDDCIIAAARRAAAMYSCSVDILTDDVDYSVFVRAAGSGNVSVLHLDKFMLEMQNDSAVDPRKVKEAAEYRVSCYTICELSAAEANAYLSDGNTLIIAAVRARNMGLDAKFRKISWLISKGADINARDHGRRFFPALTHAIQIGDLELFKFLLWDCKADPNIGSREFLERGKVRYRNEGNMPLMVAAWDGKLLFVKELLKSSRLSINQQDANGFTALMKAAMNGHKDCYKELLAAGADTKIVDIDGRTAADWLQWYDANGALRKTYLSGTRKPGGKNTDNRRKKD